MQGAGKGPLFVEFDTYRYHGHSMSDPGTTYRTREEVGEVRQARDPIEYVKKLLIDHNLATAEELKDIEKDIRASVQASLQKAKEGSYPPDENVYHEIYSDANGKEDKLNFIRMPDYHKSIGQIL